MIGIAPSKLSRSSHETPQKRERKPASPLLSLETLFSSFADSTPDLFSPLTLAWVPECLS